MSAVRSERSTHPISASLPSLLRTPDQRQRQAAERSRRSVLVSTECQTEDSALHNDARSRRRRREKRRRRRSQLGVQPLQQHVHQALEQQTQITVTPAVELLPSGHVSPGSDHLPDILNSHLPPPYSTLPLNSERCMGMGPTPSVAPGALTMGMGLPVGLGVGLLAPLVPSNQGTPTTAAPLAGSTAIQASATATATSNGNYMLPRTSRRRSAASFYAGEESSKSCCGMMVNQTVSIRWFIIMIAFVGICCAVVGTVLGALRASGREHLTVSLLMIGVGIVLITVSGIAWRLTSQDAPSCRAMLGLSPQLSPTPVETGECPAEPGRRFLARIPPTYGRPQHPYAAMMYPEFQYRPPPPSYQASMQEYRLRLLLMDRDRQQQGRLREIANLNRANGPPPSPPPTYRSNASTLRPSLQPRGNEASRPPSYRSRSSASTSESMQSVLRTTVVTSPAGHNRSLSSGTVRSVSLTEKVIVHQDPSLTKREADSNRVTIVQTTSSSQVLGRDASPVLVTVTPCEEQLDELSVQNLQVLAQL